MTTVNPLGTSFESASATTASRTGKPDGSFRAAFLDASQRTGSALAGGVAGAANTTVSSAEQEFMEYASMSLDEKMFYSALASLGISKKEYDAMSATDKQAVAAKVSLLMQQLTKADNSQLVS